MSFHPAPGAAPDGPAPSGAGAAGRGDGPPEATGGRAGGAAVEGIGGVAELLRQEAAGAPRRPPRWRITVGRALALAIVGVSLYLVAPSIGEVLSSWPRLRTIDVRWFTLVLLAQVGTFACVAVLQRLALRTNDWFAIVMSQLAGNAISRVVPAGAAAGAALQLRMLAVARVDTAAAVSGLTAFSLLQVASTLGLPLFALPALLGGYSVPGGLAQSAFLGLTAFVLVAAGGSVVLITDRPLRRFGLVVQSIRNRLARGTVPTTGLDERLLAERDAIRAALGSRWWEASLTVAGRQAFDYLSLLAAVAAVGSAPRPSLVLLAFASSTILGMIPVTPGGLGFVEAGLTAALALAGVPAADAVLATLVYRLGSYWLPILAGLVAYLLFRRRLANARRPAAG